MVSKLAVLWVNYSDPKKAAYSDVMTGQKLVVNLADY